jgi:hypothetical protein
MSIHEWRRRDPFLAHPKGETAIRAADLPRYLPKQVEVSRLASILNGHLLRHACCVGVGCSRSG